ncbi:hypothetical protein pv_126 [Pithovirus sibericum]|uniref:Uncharacterized protein n=1 Tax=Pithovirus sibericum TaxID=1450746 RepID=W5S4M5_9VIRU|nr:hypothetical protein pv_126 [Pithovirus sibericum]AHH01693.1 hypothetical protein pv_126 [Pithovirus sibericum]
MEVNLTQSYEEIRSQFPYRNFSDDFWRKKAFSDFGIGEKLFNLFHNFRMSSEERYLQLGSNFRQIRHKFKFFSPSVQLAKAAKDSSPEQFESLRKKLGVPKDCNAKFSSTALLNENFPLYSFLDPNFQILERETSSRIGSCQSGKAQHFFHSLLTSRPENLEVFQTNLFSLRDENSYLDYVEICTLWLNSKFEQKIQANLAMIERSFPGAPGSEFRRHILTRMLAFSRYSNLTDKFLQGFPYDNHKENLGRTLHYSGLMCSVIQSLKVENIEFFLSKGILFQAEDFLALIQADKSRLTDKISILETYFVPSESRCMRYGYSGSYAQWKSVKDGWGGQKEISRIAHKFLLEDQLDLFWVICRSFPEFMKKIPLRLVLQILESGHYLTARSLFRLVRNLEKKKRFVEELEPEFVLVLDFDSDLGY